MKSQAGERLSASCWPDPAELASLSGILPSTLVELGQNALNPKSSCAAVPGA